MSKKQKVKYGECVYCGKYRRITKDHVPPKNIFSSPRPNNLISVPCCLTCNKSESKDDEYFRNMIVMRYDTYDHPDAFKNWETVKRSFRRMESAGLKKSILETIQQVDLYTPTGIFLGKSGMFQVNPDRLTNTVSRIIKGIFYHEFGKRLADDYNVRTFILERIRINNEILNFINIARAGKPKIIGDRVFTYWIQKTTEDPNTTVSCPVFYERVAFIGLTFKK